MTFDPRSPIGKFTPKQAALTPEDRKLFIRQIAEAPSCLRQAVQGLNDEQLNTPYRDGGWTVRQVVHHLADSHLNAYVRTRLALTEEAPGIKPYQESLWAELYDARTLPIEPSLRLLESLHTRWIALLEHLTPAEFQRTIRHPERGIMTLDSILDLYAWHSRHHVGHVTALKKQKKW